MQITLKYNKVGDIVDININLKGREWTNKDERNNCINTIEAENGKQNKNQQIKKNQLSKKKIMIYLSE